jgi:diaminohydroxyphosphoribosylaminopyrimidine deaminase / 5-amino-6-(5-phosphoribosylamino)uracil reductase
MTRARPWLRIKTASSLDGKIALGNGDSKWITAAAARLDVHRLRARSCAILTGIGTVLADDPQLNVRGIETSRQPFKIVVDSHLRTPVNARILQDKGTIIAYTQADTARQQQLIKAGAELIQVNAECDGVDLSALLTILAQRGMNEIMTEAGAHLNASLIAAELADEWVMYMAPVLLGDTARGLFALPEPVSMTSRQALNIQDIRQIGTDLRITAHFQ